MTSMVEKVARAITRSQGGHFTGPSRHRASDEFGWDAGHAYMDKYVEKHWTENVNAAHFAIEAMLEPTEHMLSAGYAAAKACEIDWEANAAYRAMLEAALEE